MKRDFPALKAAIRNYIFPPVAPEPGDPLVVVTLPHSGSAFIREAVTKSMGLPQFHDVGSGMPVWAWLKAETMYDRIRNKRVYLKAHFSAHEYHLGICHSLGIRKLVVHMRDPREAILSYAYKLNSEEVRNNQATQLSLRAAEFILAPDHYDLSQAEQLDWLIENCLPEYVKWMEQWLAVVDADPRFDILLTQYETLEKNGRGLIEEICKFYDPTFDPELIVLPEKKRNSFTHNFREGRSGGHEREFSETQNKRAKEIIGDKFARFGWT